MRTALTISLAFHLAVSFLSVRLVRISKVRFVPRQVYSVQLVSVSEMDRAQAEKPKTEAAPPKPVIEEEKKPEELVTPPEKKRPPKKKPKPPKKVIPSTEIRKTESPEGEDSEETTPIPSTGDIALDVADFPFAYYLATIKRKIASLWNVPGIPSGDGLYCKVYFRIAAGGAIQSPVVETGSGNFLFDQAALRAVVQSNPLPPLPEGFDDEYLGVHFSFAYEKQ